MASILTCWPASTRLYLKCGIFMISEGIVVDAGDALGKVF